MRHAWSTLIAVLLLPTFAHAMDWRAGGSLGYGGAGIVSPELVSGHTQNIQRSEGPGVVSIFADLLVDEKWLLSAEHSRGFRFGPFSSGVGFTGAAMRRYLSPVPSVKDGSDESTLLVKRYAFFYGLASGVATADIHRANDLVPTVTGSGVYIGIKLGADYPVHRGWAIRPEIISNMTFLSNASPSATMTEFAVQCSFYFFL